MRDGEITLRYAAASDATRLTAWIRELPKSASRFVMPIIRAKATERGY